VRASDHCAFTRLCRRALDTAFEEMRDAELLRDLAQVALHARSYIHHRGAADHLEIATLASRQDFILHAVGKKCVVGVALRFSNGKTAMDLFREAPLKQSSMLSKAGSSGRRFSGRNN